MRGSRRLKSISQGLAAAALQARDTSCTEGESLLRALGRTHMQQGLCGLAPSFMQLNTSVNESICQMINFHGNICNSLFVCNKPLKATLVSPSDTRWWPVSGSAVSELPRGRRATTWSNSGEFGSLEVDSSSATCFGDL